MAQENPSQPLTPAVLHILLALGPGERHGYGIMKQVEQDSAGQVKMGPGTLYGSLRRMLEAGLVRETASREKDGDARRRVYYELTGEGRSRLQAELGRYQALLEVAHQRHLKPKGPAYGF